MKNHPDEEEFDQSPIRPTLGPEDWRAQLSGKGSAGPPPRVRPEELLSLLSDILSGE